MVFTTSSAANSRSPLISTTGITSYINDDPKGETIVKTALQYLGTKYCSGRSGPGGFDCSRGSSSVGHVGIVTDVADNGQSFKFVHAARTGVQVDSSDQAYYSKRYMGARRIIDEK